MNTGTKVLIAIIALGALARLVPDDYKENKAREAAAEKARHPERERAEWLSRQGRDLRAIARSNKYKDSDRYKPMESLVTDLGDTAYLSVRFTDTTTGGLAGLRGHYDTVARKRISIKDIRIVY